MSARLALKVDVDTDRGTRDGVLPIARICQRHGIPATFLFSLGPDNTGKAISRVFRPGFLKKVMRTNVASNYGLRTLMNGTLLPAPHVGRRNEAVLREVRDLGFEVGVHCYDHYQWQDHLHTMPITRIRNEFQRAVIEFTRIFGTAPRAAGAPGWQCNAKSLEVYDEAGLLYGSDVRGRTPFVPSVGERTFKTPQISTTLPTFDELLGRPEYPDDRIVDHLLRLLAAPGDHVHTIHAELEGLRYAALFEELVQRAKAAGVVFVTLESMAKSWKVESLAVCGVEVGPVDGRSGDLALQGRAIN